MENWNINRVITPLNTKLGAPMGRPNKGNEEDFKGVRVYDKRVPLIDGYDKGGAYWGVGHELRVKFSSELNFIKFYWYENQNK